MALCSESTGTTWSGPAAAFTSGPPMMSDSLLASASTEPASSAARVGRSPIEPVTPLRTTSAPHPAATVAASSPTTTSGADAATPASAAACATAARTSSTEPRAAATSGTRNSTAWRASRSRLPPALSATIVKRPGCAATTSRAWVPIEPVEPRTATVRVVTGPLSAVDDRDGKSGLRW